MKPKSAIEAIRLPVLEALRGKHDVLLAGGILSILFVILVPLPPSIIDPLLILNLTISVVVLLTAACVSRPLEFSVFPSLLLVTTFFRLALNIATTRLILGNAVEGQFAAGQVVQTFGNFVTGDNPVIGLIIFMVIVVVQFVVLTKGATRVSEVAARFQLDAMPGKQMSIDGDLAAGLIDQEAARARRQEVSNEADFYGSMDGASKFVRGDAVAGLVIVMINIIGGVAVGLLYHGMSIGEAVDVFMRLTIGDGLVSQVPALMISVAAALLVTRSAASEHLGKDLSRQIFSNDQVFYVAAAFLLLLIPSGLPILALLVGATICGFCGYILGEERRTKQAGIRLQREVQKDALRKESSRPEVEAPRDVRSMMRVDPITLVIGYRLLPLMNAASGGGVLARVNAMREKIALELGLVVPPIQIRDSRSIPSCDYSVQLRGNPIGRWTLRMQGTLIVPRSEDVALATDQEGLSRGPELQGRTTYWIGDDVDLENAESWRFLKPIDALSEHLEELLRQNAAQILTREEVSRMLEDLAETSPNLVEDLVPGVISSSDLHRVLQGLLRESVSIRDLESILEALSRGSPRANRVEDKVEELRRSLALSVCRPSMGSDGKLHVVLLEPALEEFLLSSLACGDGDEDSVLNLDPQTTGSIGDKATMALRSVDSEDYRLAVLCSPKLRPHLWRIVCLRVPGAPVLSYDEVVDEAAVEVHGSVSLDTSARYSGVQKEVKAGR